MVCSLLAVNLAEVIDIFVIFIALDIRAKGSFYFQTKKLLYFCLFFKQELAVLYIL